MTSGPRITIGDEYILGMACAVCGADTLAVSHVADLPDFVECGNCSSAFLVEEGGERVFYGKIAPGYPETERFALQQWVWIDAVDKHARGERPEGEEEIDIASRLSFEVAPEEEDTISELSRQPGVPLASLGAFDETEGTDEALSESVDAEPVDSDEILDRLAAQAPEESPAVAEEAPPTGEPEEEAPPAVFVPRETDPPPGQRYRVVTRGDQVIFPNEACAHCMRTPVKGRLAVLGTLPKGQDIRERQKTTFNIPLCAECRKRASALSDDARNARLQAHLISAIIALVLVIAVLAIGIVNTRDMGLPGIAILIIVSIIGYTIPAMILLGRVGKYPPPPDAAYIRSTLLIPRETQGLETAFEWRNPDYAEQFHDANVSNALGNLTAVKDRSAPPDRII